MILKNHIYWITAITSARKEEDRNSIVSKGRGREEEGEKEEKEWKKDEVVEQVEEEEVEE